jgi:hypothetical protein
MKQFIIEWCIIMVMALAIVVYIGIFILVTLLLDDSTIKGAIYISLWVVFYAVTTVTSYVRYCNRKRK